MKSLQVLAADAAKLAGITYLVLLALVIPFQIAGFSVVSGASVSLPVEYNASDALVVLPGQAADRPGVAALWSDGATTRVSYALRTARSEGRVLVSNSMLLGQAVWIPMTAVSGVVVFTVPLMGWLVGAGYATEFALASLALVPMVAPSLLRRLGALRSTRPVQHGSVNVTDLRVETSFH